MMEMDTDPLEGSSYELGVTVKAEIKEEDEDEHYNTISRRAHRVSLRQLDVLWDFLNSNRDIATANNRSLQAKEYSKRKWTEVAKLLNAQTNGSEKDWRGWSKYWVDYKAKLKARATAAQAARVWSAANERPLSDVELKYLKILGVGVDLGQAWPSIQVSPLRMSEPPENGRTSTTIDIEVQNSPSESISQYPTAQHPSVEHIHEDAPAPSPIGSPTPPRVATPSGRSPRRRRRRREPPMSQEVARRALVRSSQIRAEAALRTCAAMEAMVEKMSEYQSTALRIERILTAAFPAVANNIENT